MKVGIWPFWSQQNKMNGHVHMRGTCGNAKQLAFAANVLQSAGIECVVAVPSCAEGASPFTCKQITVDLPRDNAVQRIHWNTEDMRCVFSDCDVALLNNEYMAIPLRTLFPKLKIIQMCPVPIDSGLFKHAFDAANVVVARSRFAAGQIQQYTYTPVIVWPMFYDENLFAMQQQPERDIDVLFLPRCSANNATHHEEFLEAARPMGWRIAFTDVTSYLRQTSKMPLSYSSPENYVETLFRSKIAVSLYNSWNGEMGLFEAVRAGCVPVVARTANNIDLLGASYPYFVELPVTPYNLRQVICKALGDIADDSHNPLKCLTGSYQKCGNLILEAVCRL